ncbi:MAG: hypothetical protein COB36_14520 [Alphaproteobacteria bacterium]|nr:MAG: hypothetical protein COB36_14520 [Alphaproteobacteria bacterium]
MNKSRENWLGKVAVVTGGGSGLGRELALCCARKGMHVVLADMNEAGMGETVTRIQALAPTVRTLIRTVDVSSLEQMQNLATTTMEEFGGVHLLFNNAGVGVKAAPIWEYTLDDWQWVTNINIYGVAWGVKAFVPIMLEQNDGHIVNTASAAGWLNGPASGVYNVSKCGVVALSESLLMDLRDAQTTIGVSVLCPAFFASAIADCEANRPDDLSNTAPDTSIGRQRSEEVKFAMTRGRKSAADIAAITFAGIEAEQFYIFPHSKIKSLILGRAEALQRDEAFNTLEGRGS